MPVVRDRWYPCCGGLARWCPLSRVRLTRDVRFCSSLEPRRSVALWTRRLRLLRCPLLSAIGARLTGPLLGMLVAVKSRSSQPTYCKTPSSFPTCTTKMPDPKMRHFACPECKDSARFQTSPASQGSPCSNSNSAYHSYAQSTQSCTHPQPFAATPCTALPSACFHSSLKLSSRTWYDWPWLSKIYC